MTKQQRSEAINYAWDGMEEMQSAKETSASPFQSRLFELIYRIFWILYLILTEKR